MPPDTSLELRLAHPDDAAAVLRVIRAAFGARPPLDPPAEALSDTEDDVRLALEQGAGVVAELDGRPVGCLLVHTTGQVASVRRVSVVPEAHGQGVAAALVAAALTVAAEDGAQWAELVTRHEFPHLQRWWEGRGFRVHREHPLGHVMRRRVPVLLDVPDADSMQQLGVRLAGIFQPGDVVVASGPLGAGKTTLAQGIGQGLGVEGPVTSPTFVISRVHPSLTGRPALVHVDAYRVGAADELADIDLDATLPTSVTLVEWGENKAEWLSSERLEIRIEREPGTDVRTVQLDGTGPRWDGALETLREER